jgi:hypothetical protein
MKIIGWLLGLDNVTTIDEIDPSLAAPWAHEGPFWVLVGTVCLFVASLVFYVRFQKRGSFPLRAALGISRGLLLTLLFLTLADPVLRITVTNLQHPLLYVVLDGTDSMAIQDELPPDQRAALAEAVGLPKEKSPAAGDATAPLSRISYVQSLLGKKENNLLKKLQDEKKYRVEAFLFDGNNTSQLRKLDLNGSGGDKIDPPYVAGQVTTKGQVTAMGSMLTDVSQQFGTGNLAGVVLFSDFAHNSGIAPLGNRGGQDQSPASKLRVPIYTVGVGATEAIDLAVDLQTDPKMKRAEKTNISVKLRQTGLQGRNVTVRVLARPLSGEFSAAGTGAAEILVGQKTVALTSAVDNVEFPFTPKDAGRFEFVAEVEPLPGEVVDQNNRAVREVNIIDDYLRLMYVAHEPDWEWRFVKEVFHRDKLVGMQGFRTYLASSDPRVRETNILFLPTLTPKRSDFFANDVIFIDDMPQTALSPRFNEMVKEFVGQFGGGLVIMAGPRFGPRELHGTPLADMLPVIIDPDARLRDEREFRLRLTAHAARYPFMQLGENDVENAKAWDNLGQLPWYQPVAQLHEQGIALAEHPTDLCSDGKTPQPLIAIRQYGAGEVVYIGFNETWRLRRRYGEKYYREYWSQLIYRLGMSHALGSEKRFVVRTDRQQYRAEEKVSLTVEAYDENFEPLTEDKLADRSLTAELIVPGNGGGLQTRPIAVPLLRKGVFEARIPVYTAGEYSLRVKDPVTGKSSEVRFEVAGLSAERRSAVRNVRLQEDLAAETHGRSYDLTTVSNLVNDLKLEPIAETYTRNHALWSTKAWFIVLVTLMLSEWLIRKLINLA